MFSIFLLFTALIFNGICAQSYQDVNRTISAVGQSLTWTHAPSMGAYRIHISSPPDSLVQATCNIVTNCQTQSFVISRSGELDLSKDGRRQCGNGNLPATLSIGNEIVVALNAKANEGATFRCVFQAIAQTDANCDCGWRKETRIVGGSVARANEFVSHAGFVYYYGAGNHDVFCGGVIRKIKLLGKNSSLLIFFN